MDTASAPAADQANVRYGYASFWWRVLATLIDVVVIGLFGGIASALFIVVPILLPVAPFLVGAAYVILLESSPSQGTVGKMICRLKVADMEGRRISVGKAALRYICHWLSTLLFFIGYLLVFFTKRKQALHDMMAGTVVLRVTEDRTFSDPIAGFHAQQTQAALTTGGTAAMTQHPGTPPQAPPPAAATAPPAAPPSQAPVPPAPEQPPQQSSVQEPQAPPAVQQTEPAPAPMQEAQTPAPPPPAEPPAEPQVPPQQTPGDQPKDQ